MRERSAPLADLAFRNSSFARPPMDLSIDLARDLRQPCGTMLTISRTSCSHHIIGHASRQFSLGRCTTRGEREERKGRENESSPAGEKTIRAFLLYVLSPGSIFRNATGPPFGSRPAIGLGRNSDPARATAPVIYCDNKDEFTRGTRRLHRVLTNTSGRKMRGYNDVLSRVLDVYSIYDGLV